MEEKEKKKEEKVEQKCKQKVQKERREGMKKRELQQPNGRKGIHAEKEGYEEDRRRGTSVARLKTIKKRKQAT